MKRGTDDIMLTTFFEFPTSYITFRSHLLIAVFVHNLVRSYDEVFITLFNYWTFNLNVMTADIDINFIVVDIMITINVDVFNTIQICINIDVVS